MFYWFYDLLEDIKEPYLNLLFKHMSPTLAHLYEYKDTGESFLSTLHTMRGDIFYVCSFVF